MKRAFVFPGQGTQYIGMGLDIYKSSSMAKMLFDRANDILQYNLIEIMFNGPEEKLCQTEIAQPAIFLHSYVSYRLLSRQPDMAAGHSLGMYAALASAGAFNFEDALRLVQTMAQAMRYASTVNPGTMAVIMGLVDSDVERICREVNEIKKIGYVKIANYNCSGQVVVSGTEFAVIEAMKLARQEGAPVRKIPVSGAFHSILMEPAYERLSIALYQAQIHACTFPVYSDLDASVLDDPCSIFQSLIRQLVHPVCWPNVIWRMVAEGANEFIEIGPGKVLQGLIKRINKNVKVSG